MVCPRSTEKAPIVHIDGQFVSGFVFSLNNVWWFERAFIFGDKLQPTRRRVFGLTAVEQCFIDFSHGKLYGNSFWPPQDSRIRNNQDWQKPKVQTYDSRLKYVL